MRNGQNKRMRGRNNHRKNHNPMARVFESNGPDVKIRGNPSHIAEKYIQLARDAQTSGDPIAAENYYQHAEHYFRVIAAAQEQFRQNNPHFSRPENEMSGARDEGFDDGDDDGNPWAVGRSPYGTREPQPYIPRDAQPSAATAALASTSAAGNAGRRRRCRAATSFITGGQQRSAASSRPAAGPNGHDNQPDVSAAAGGAVLRPRPDVQGGGDGGTADRARVITLIRCGAK